MGRNDLNIVDREIESYIDLGTDINANLYRSIIV